MNNLSDNIVQSQTGDSNTSLREWSFTTQSNNPMVTSSQYISIETPDLAGTDRRYRALAFNIETHVRVGNGNQSRRSFLDVKSEK